MPRYSITGLLLTTDDGAIAQAGQYTDAFVVGMFYNLGAALLVYALLLLLVSSR